MAPDGSAVFPKGENWKNEVSAARAEWNFNLKTVTSKTDPKAVILRIEGVERA
jgi:16S rRNA (guanine527-N7)-methyltransferase